MIPRHIAKLACLVLVAAVPAPAVELSVWANHADIGFAPVSIAYNSQNGRLLLAGSSLVEWQRGASSGTELVAAANWVASAMGATYVPSRGTYLVVSSGDAAIYEITPGVADQTPYLYVDVTAANPLYEPQGGLPQDGTYAYYKAQWTSIEQPVRRITLVGTNGVDTEYVPQSAFNVWSSSGPSQEMTLNSANVLHLSARNNKIDANRGIYRWDESSGNLVPVIQEPAILAHTGQSNTRIYGMTFDALDNLYFYEIYSASILRLDRHGNLTTFLTNEEIRTFMNDPSMSVHPSYMVAVGTELILITGNVSGHVLAARLPMDPEMVTVPGTDFESNGPTYSYEIGKYEITNAQYCTFLNDAELTQQTNPADPRCSNMWFDPTNGDVYMTDVTGFPVGPERYDRTLYKTSDIPDSKIKYNIANAPGARFYVIEGLEQHPVGTVSWFGAAKMCNWLTVTTGLPAADICYHEGPNKEDWYAITASDWNTNGLLEAERLELVRDYRGYRLPMDGVNYDNGGVANATSWNIDANPYNEWYKAAAFDRNAPDVVRAGPGDGELVQPDHWLYGFGGDTFTGAEANTAGSPKPFLETSPVGYYDGVNMLMGGIPTVDTQNPYGIYDMCGNVSEWINDTALEYPWGSTYRATRGGSYANSDVKYATASTRQITTARYYAENYVGFRVARSFGYADFDGDGTVSADDYAFFAIALTGPGGAIAPGSGHEACDYDGDGDVDLWDFARLQERFGGN